MMFQDVFDALLAYASNGTQASVLAAARKLYEAQTGEIFASDASFERRIAAFLEWYVLDARPEGGEPPIVAYMAEQDFTAAPATLAALNAWRASRLSLFEVRRLRADRADVLDLLTGGKHQIAQAQLLLGCASGTLVIARLLQAEATTVLTDGVLYLPAAAGKDARKVAKALRRAGGTPKEQLALVLRLAFLANRCERYKHVDAKTIFAEVHKSCA